MQLELNPVATGDRTEWVGVNLPGFTLGIENWDAVDTPPDDPLNPASASYGYLGLGEGAADLYRVTECSPAAAFTKIHLTAMVVEFDIFQAYPQATIRLGIKTQAGELWSPEIALKKSPTRPEIIHATFEANFRANGHRDWLQIGQAKGASVTPILLLFIKAVVEVAHSRKRMGR